MKLLGLAAIASLFAAGCGDPVLDAQAAALPPEVPGIRTGPTHRGGQPCTLCHSDEGGRHPAFSLAGTVYQKPTNQVPIQGAIVRVTDAIGTTQDLTTNCAGNFYIAETQWQPVFPIRIDLADPQSGLATKMKSKVGRDPSCGSCHVDPAGMDSPGHVYLTSDPTVPDLQAPLLSCGR